MSDLWLIGTMPIPVFHRSIGSSGGRKERRLTSHILDLAVSFVFGPNHVGVSIAPISTDVRQIGNVA